MAKRTIYICDWLPPEFGAVGQYALQTAKARAKKGEWVVLAGLSSEQSLTRETYGTGRLITIKCKAGTYDKNNLRERALWTARVNMELLAAVQKYVNKADEIIFTGSPPFMLHFIAPLNALFFRKKVVYRITDFYPEVMMAGLDAIPLTIRALSKLTQFWRRRVDQFEVLGQDQMRHLLEMGIPESRIRLARDTAPVEVDPDTPPMSIPNSLKSKVTLLYSGNFGVAHEHETFLAGYRAHHCNGSGRVGLWLNAIGAKADEVEAFCRTHELPCHRGRPVPLEALASLLCTPDAHLITLRDPFVGYVLPSKVYGSILSMKPILFVGSEQSDVHLLAKECDGYHRVPVGDSLAVANALESIADQVGLE